MKPIALLTDFGLEDYYVGAMKGVILSISPNAPIIDISHNIRPQDIRSAAFVLAACWRDFPEGTIFVAVVDPGVGSDRRAILATAEGRFFVAPDNGLLSFVLNGGSVLAFQLTNEKYFKHPISRTFHGRDIFAPVAAHLSNGTPPEEFGPQIRDFVRFESSRPRRNSNGEAEGEIIYIDVFGNLVTNLRRGDVPAEFVIEINGHQTSRLAEFYAGETAGEIFAIFGSAGYLEISANRDSAARLLNANVGEKVLVKEQDVYVS